MKKSSLLALTLLGFSMNAFAMRIEHARVSMSAGAPGTCTASGSFFTASWTSTGKCNLASTGFTAVPTCTTSVDDVAGAVEARIASSTTTSTSIDVVVVDFNSGLADANFNIICVGD